MHRRSGFYLDRAFSSDRHHRHLGGDPLRSSRVRGRTRKSTCQSNLKQIGMAMMQYVQDYDETLPQHYFRSPSDVVVSSIITLLHPYVKNVGVWDCPSADMKCKRSGSDPIVLGDRSYGWNSLHLPSHSPRGWQDSPHPRIPSAPRTAPATPGARAASTTPSTGARTDPIDGSQNNSWWDTDAHGGVGLASTSSCGTTR